MAVGLRGVLKGDLKGLERAEELSMRRRFTGGGGDIMRRSRDKWD